MKNFTNLLVKDNLIILEAIKKLDKNNIKFLIVVDRSGKLVGTITDGDIRRGLLRGITTNQKTSDIMRKNPFFLKFGENKDIAIKMMKRHKIVYLPIVDKRMKVIELEILKQSNDKKKMNPVLIMAGGFGTRLMPLTENIPKPMLIIGNRPILETILMKLAKEGFENFYISVHYKSEIIKNYFKDGSSFGIKISYLQEKKPLGTGGAISLLPFKEINKPIIVMNGDIITDLNFNSLIEFHQNNKAFATVCCSKYTIKVPYGVITQKNNEMTSLIEKPSQDFFINAGIYIFNKGILALLNSNKMDITDVLNKINRSKKKISVFPIHEKWIDIGHHKEFKLAQTEGANNS